MRSALIFSPNPYPHTYILQILVKYHSILLTRLTIQGQVFQFAQRLQQTLQCFQTSSHRNCV